MTEIEGAVAQFLQSLSKTDSIDLDNIIKYISMTREEREIIESHPFKIWQGNNQKWYTYVPDEEKGRRLVKRATEQKLMMAVISYYRDKEETRSEQKQLNVQKSVEAIYSSEPAEPTLAKKLAQPEPEHVGMTLRELYLEWREYKALHTNAMSYIAKIANDWFRYYEEDEIAQKDLAELDSKYLDYWLHSCIKRLSLTKKQYFSMSIILRQGLEYACNQGYLTENPILKVKVNSKMLHRPPRKPDSKQVFLVDEQSKVQEVAYRLYQERGDPIWLAIPLTFQLGVRVGELSAFKSTDIEGDYIHIQRMERREYVPPPAFYHEKAVPGSWPGQLLACGYLYTMFQRGKNRKQTKVRKRKVRKRKVRKRKRIGPFRIMGSILFGRADAGLMIKILLFCSSVVLLPADLFQYVNQILHRFQMYTSFQDCVFQIYGKIFEFSAKLLGYIRHKGHLREIASPELRVVCGRVKAKGFGQ